MGGSREALAKGVAAGDAAQAISQGATDFYGAQYGLAQQAAGALPGMAGAVANLGMMPLQAQWMPWQAQQGILGGPAVLNRSNSLSESLARSQGENMQYGQSSQMGFNLW
jgi:hypothetical protein